MQLFGLVNTMLNHDRTTAERALSIARYAVIPLSPNSGDLVMSVESTVAILNFRALFVEIPASAM